ncbi:MAG: glycosyltransferase family 4 protein [Acidimicrobiales bacterium]
MSDGLSIGVVKPDWGVAGGFERLLTRLTDHLVEVGHDVRYETFPALITPRESWGLAQARRDWHEHPEFFRYLGLIEEVRRLDLDRYDLVLSTQPPTFLADHPRVLALFYHQARIFYDLAGPYVELGEVDPVRHRSASRIVNETDRALSGGVAHWLAGSQECANRLDEYWDVPDDRVSIVHAPALTEVPADPPPWDPAGPVLCVSRHEWPKRTEFVVAAAQLVDRPVELVGGGGREAFLRRLDAELTRQPELASTGDPAELWMRSALDVRAPEGAAGTARILGNVDDTTRNNAYARASVVVAPAYREDYGLTALEAMLWRRPLIVCRDGGGLVDIVADTGAGLVVDPTPSAIAEGVQRIVEDRAFTSDMLERAAEVPARYTWARCHAQLDDAVERAMAD